MDKSIEMLVILMWSFLIFYSMRIATSQHVVAATLQQEAANNYFVAGVFYALAFSLVPLGIMRMGGVSIPVLIIAGIWSVGRSLYTWNRLRTRPHRPLLIEIVFLLIGTGFGTVVQWVIFKI